MFRSTLILILFLSAGTFARCEEANVTEAQAGVAGAVHTLITAQRSYEEALKTGDVLLLLASVRLARGVVLRPPTSWDRVTEGESPEDQPQGKEAAPDPASPTALAILQTFAGEDPALQDLVYDLDAQLPRIRKPHAISRDADLGIGQADLWRMPLFGSVPAEIGLIGDGDGPLSLTITDGAGLQVCVLPPGVAPGLCAFTPARNGFFTVTIRNHGSLRNTYRLLAN